MKISSLSFLLMFVAVIFGFLTYFFYNSFIVENIITLNMLVKVNDHFGLNADGDAIKFGMVMPGASGERSITVNNSAAYPLRVVISKSGYIADWVRVSENNFVLKGNENRQVIFKVSAPENADFGEYNGTATIIFKKVLFSK